MALTSQQKEALLRESYAACSTAVQQGIQNRENGTLAEKLLPTLFALQAQLDDTNDDIVRFEWVKDDAALFGYHVKNLSIKNIEEVLDSAMKAVSLTIGIRFGQDTFEDYVEKIKRLLRDLDKRNVLNVENWKKHIEPNYFSPNKAKKRQNTDGAFFSDDDLAAIDCIADIPPKIITIQALLERGDQHIQGWLNNCTWLLESMRRSKQKGEFKPIIDEEVLFSALAGCSGFASHCSEAFGLPAFRVGFPRKALAHRIDSMEKVDKRTVHQRSGSMRGTSKDYFSAAQDEHKNTLMLDSHVAEILQVLVTEKKGEWVFHLDKDVLKEWCDEAASTSKRGTKYPLLTEFLSLNRQAAEKTPFALAKSVSRALKRDVVGQDEAVDKVTSHLLTLLFGRSRTHLGVSTFLGPSGTGKTHLASTMKTVLNDVLQSGFQVKLFNMEQFNGEKDVSKLFGSGSQYADAALGSLTLSALKNPRTLFIFDEIEKASPAVIQSLLTPIDKGYAVDFTTDMVVDLSQCMFIFTTNLGGDMLSKKDGSLNINPLELLTQPQKDSSPALSPEMTNRLASGTIAVFRELDERALTTLANISARMASSTVLTPPANLDEMILATLCADATPRTIAAQWQKIEGRVIKELIDIVPEDDMHKLNNAQFVKTGFIDLSSGEIKLNIITNSPLPSMPSGISVQGYSPDLVNIELAFTQPADAVVLDVDAMGDLMPKVISTLKQHPQTTLFSFSANNEKTNILQHNVLHYVDEHVTLDGNSKAHVSALFRQVQRHIQLIRFTGDAVKRNLYADYAFDYEIKKDGIDIQLNHFSQRQRVRKQDAALPFLTFAEKPNLSLNDMIGMEQEKAQLKLIIQGLKANDDTLPLPSGYLLTGRPGTGKTHMAKCIAGESDTFCFGVDAVSLLNGNVVDNIQQLFAVARRYAPSIVFLDEFDAIGKSRQSSHFMNTDSVNALLTAMQGFSTINERVFVLAATNHPEALDEALLRPGRFDRTIQFDAPDELGRRHCITQWFKKRNETLPSRLEEQLVKLTQGGTVPDINHVFDQSLLSVLSQGVPWQPEMLKEAVQTARFGKVSPKQYSAKQRRITAYHEAGHLVAHKLLLPDVPVEMATIQARGSSLGMVVPGQSDKEKNTTRRYVKHYLQICLAGIVAENLIGILGDEQTNGGTADRQMATRVAKQAIVEWGMSERFGLALPSELAVSDNDINDEVLIWLAQAQHDVSTLLEKHRTLLDKAATALIKYETLSTADIDDLFSLIHRGSLVQAL
ncbi:hypothetical protein KUL156_18540 [Alteromonas sp. KUL156]|nr:hypothetical protein KUL154_45000 [Alteromonas sp. KUL154]GFD99261.1 hypothetical protein KUL156_18540 [Alteromonas sp. KUL156]